MQIPQKLKPDVEISIQDPEWEKMPNIYDVIKMTSRVALNNAILPKACIGRDLEISVVLANDDLMQVLNREYRSKDKPTNVLTFASLDSEEIPTTGTLNLGDIILSYQTIDREAQEQGKFPLDHIKHLTVHGVLHLLGYDHEDEDEANDMETLEIRILEQMGVQNPYTEMNF